MKSKNLKQLRRMYPVTYPSRISPPKYIVCYDNPDKTAGTKYEAYYWG